MKDIDRLNTIREEVAKQDRLKSKYQGELEGYEKRKSEIAKECYDNFSTELKDLPTVIEQLEQEASEKLLKAEKILNLNQAEG